MDLRERTMQELTRRHFFQSGALSIGSIALASLCQDSAIAQPQPASSPLAERAPHFEPRIKSIIFLFMCGGPSQVDLLDPKPALKKWDGAPVPAELVQGERFAFITGRPSF